MKKLMIASFMSLGVIIPLINQQPPIKYSDSVEFGSARNLLNERDIKLNELEIEKLRELRLEQERLRQEELERIRLEEIEASKVNTYDPYNLLTPSNITREEMYLMLEGTALQSASNCFVYAEELYGVNSLVLVSITAQESSWGRSSLAINNNNLSGIKNSDGSWRYFDSWGDCIDYKARLLKNQYLSEDGNYFNGYSIWNVNYMYCEQKDWADKVSSIAYGLLKKLSE